MPRWLILLICLIRFHDLRVIQELSPYARKLQCRRCKRYFAMHDPTRSFLSWDGDLEHLYADVLGLGRTRR